MVASTAKATTVGLVLLVMLVYGLTAYASIGLATDGTHASAVWPPSGVALAALLMGGRRLAPAIFLGAVLSNAAVWLATSDGQPHSIVLASVMVGLGNLAEALIAHHLLTRSRPRGFELAQPQDVYVFALAVLIAGLASSGIGVGSLHLQGVIASHQIQDALLTWWLGDVTGMLVVAPPLMLLHPSQRARWRWGGLKAGLLSIFLLVASCVIVFGGITQLEGASRWSTMLLLAAVVHAAYQHGQVGAGLAGLAVSSLCILQTIRGHGPFAAPSTNDALISLDGFLALCVVSGLVVSVSRSEGDRAPHEQPARRSQLLPVGMLMLSLSVTIAMWHLTAADTDRRAEDRFEQASRRLRDRVAERMETYAFALSGGQGLFNANGTVSATDWHAYVSSLRIQQRFPGIQGLGYAKHIKASELRAHEAAMLRQGHPQYEVRPAGPRGEYTAILYLEPMDVRNRRALGYDMFSEPVRREAMSRARDSGEVAVTGRVKLLQEGTDKPQAGVLMYLPVYKAGMPTRHAAERQAALVGYVYAPFRTGDLMRGILSADETHSLSVDLHLSSQPSADNLVYSSLTPSQAHAPTAPWLTRRWPVSFGGQQWTLQVRATPRFMADSDPQKAQMVLMAGMLISFLLFSVVRSLTRHRQDAQALADNILREHDLSEARFKSLARSAGDGIIVTDQTGQITFCNDTAANMLGYDVASLTGQDVRCLVPGITRPRLQRWLNTIAEATANGAVATRSIRSGQALRQDGRLLPVQASACAWHTHGTRQVGIMIRDISEQLEAMAQLEQSRTTLSTILQQIPAMVGSWDENLHNRFCNPAYTDWFGIDPDATVGMHIRDVLGDELFERNLPFIEQVLRGERVTFERVITSPDGRVRHGQAHYIPDIRHGQVKGFFVLVFDVTPLKLAQQALQQHLKVHDVIFNHSVVGIALTRHNLFERVSHEFTHLLGYPDRALETQALQVMLPVLADRNDIMTLVDRTLPQGGTLDLELHLRRMSGDLVWCRVLAKAIDPSDMTQGVIWIVQDYRDRKQRESLLQRAREDAESAARLKAEFLARMSHEIRTPMNGIIGLTALTLEDDLSPPQLDNLSLVLDSALSLRRLLDDLLDFSRMEADKLSLVCADFSLRDALSTAVRPMASLAAQRQVSFVLDVAPNVPERLYGDALRVMQVLGNLCSNAIKFTEQGEVVCSVSVESMTSKTLTLRFSVEDTGPGIPPVALPHIFESFVQADNSVTRRHGGTGLGLAICAQLVKLMQGQIDVHSTDGQGSTFWFTLTFQRSSAPPMLSREHARLFHGRRVGSAVSSARSQAALHRQLSAWGITHEAIHATADLDEARTRFDLLLADAAQSRRCRDTTPLDLPAAQHACPMIVLTATGAPLDSVTAGPWRLRTPWLSQELASALGEALLAGTNPAQRTPAHGIAPAPRQGLSILLAEDHPINRHLATQVLEKRGHQVTAAHDGLDAVLQAQSGEFDIILMDVQMPNMDGLAATREIRRLQGAQGRYTPILGLSAHALIDEMAQMRASGMDECLAKPFNTTELMRMIEQLVQRASPTLP